MNNTKLRFGAILLILSLNNKDIELNTNAHSVDIVYGDCTIQLDSGKLKITDIADNFGLIIKES